MESHYASIHVCASLIDFRGQNIGCQAIFTYRMRHFEELIPIGIKEMISCLCADVPRVDGRLPEVVKTIKIVLPRLSCKLEDTHQNSLLVSISCLTYGMRNDSNLFPGYVSNFRQD